MNEKQWLMLNYTLPKEPSRVRVSVWRKLKKSGSVNIGQSMWILPHTEIGLAAFERISEEITGNCGEAYIAYADFTSETQSASIITAFHNARNEEYAEFLEKCEDFAREIEKETQRKNFSFAEIEELEQELEKLSAWIEKICARDFFGAPLKAKSGDELKLCEELLSEFSAKVYEINDIKES